MRLMSQGSIRDWHQVTDARIRHLFTDFKEEREVCAENTWLAQPMTLIVVVATDGYILQEVS